MLARFILTFASWGVMTSALSALDMPVSMLELCDRADLIVEARPGPSVRIPDKNFSRLYRVQLTILNKLKGEASADVINVIYGGESVCSHTPRYPEGIPLVAFLSWHEDIGAYITVGHSAETNCETAAELEVTHARIEEAVGIVDDPPSRSRQERVTEWFVRCLEHSATFAAGLNLLARSRWGDAPKLVEINPLSIEQQRRTVRGMVRAGYFPEDLQALIQGLKDPALEFQLLAMIQRGEGGPELMRFVADWTENRQALRVAGNYERLQDLAAEFIAAYGGMDYQAASAKLVPASRMSLSRISTAALNTHGFSTRTLPGVGRRIGLTGTRFSRETRSDN